MKKKRKQLAVGSNGYYFIDMNHVSEEEFNREFIKQKLEDIEQKLDILLNKS